MPALVTLLNKKKRISMNDDIIEYIGNDNGCRRDFLFENMDCYEHTDMGSKCLCCDVCAVQCECGSRDTRNADYVFL